MFLVTFKVKVNAFSCKCISSLTAGSNNFKLCRYIARSHDVEGTGRCFVSHLDPKVK